MHVYTQALLCNDSLLQTFRSRPNIQCIYLLSRSSSPRTGSTHPDRLPDIYTSHTCLLLYWLPPHGATTGKSNPHNCPHQCQGYIMHQSYTDGHMFPIWWNPSRCCCHCLRLIGTVSHFPEQHYPPPEHGRSFGRCCLLEILLPATATTPHTGTGTVLNLLACSSCRARAFPGHAHAGAAHVGNHSPANYHTAARKTCWQSLHSYQNITRSPQWPT